MGKQYQKQKWLPRSKSDAHAEKTPRLQRLTNQVSLIKQFILDFGLIILVVFGLGLFIFEIFRFEVILEPIEVTEDIAKQGYTGIVVAEQLTDAALNIERDTQELSAQFEWHKDAMNMRAVGTNARTLDISIPGSPFSIRSIARFIRKELDLPADYLRGEIVHEKNGLRLTLRNLSDPKVAVVRISKKTIEELFQEGGVALLQLTTPSALAMNAYHKFDNSLSDPIAQEATYNKAVRLFEYCLKYPPITDDPLVHTLWGAALLDRKHPEEAIEQFRKATNIDPKYASAYYGWGATLQDLNRSEEAIEQYRKAININPKYVEVWNNWGTALKDLKRTEEAIEQYRKAIDIDTNYVHAYNNWGAALLDLNRPEEAIEKFRKATDIDPNYADAYNNWGVALQDLKHPEEAIEQYRKAIDINPNYADAYNSWGTALLDLKHPEEAIEQYRKAIDINPNYADAYSNWGVALQDLKRTEEAIKQFRKAIDINPNVANACTNWFFALRHLKHPEEATEKHNETCVPVP